MIKKSLLLKAVLLLLPASFANAQVSPDGKLQVTVKCEGGNPVYTVTYNGNQCMKASPLGLNTNIGDFTKGLSLTATSAVETVKTDYTLYNIKRKDNHYEANQQTYTFAKDGKDVLKA
ncbi:MAG: glycoside hydrolase family 97 N-terminal domain-containing protein, partial [Prevotella sp.]|nr:glycoside hydrolase family 97 N-terminal domain-containing protein [Prevotella sp.]